MNATHGVPALRPERRALACERLRLRNVEGRTSTPLVLTGRPSSRSDDTSSASTEPRADNDDLLRVEVAECVLDREHRVGFAGLAADLAGALEQPLGLEHPRAGLAVRLRLVGCEPVERPHVRRRDHVDRGIAVTVLLDRSFEPLARGTLQQQDQETPAHIAQA